jgi:hypothetical protein
MGERPIKSPDVPGPRNPARYADRAVDFFFPPVPPAAVSNH